MQLQPRFSLPNDKQQIRTKHIVTTKTITTSDFKINTILKTNKKTLLTISTVFPFDFFPDTLTIDPIKVTLIHREFFLSMQKSSILVINIRHVSVDSGPIFATITVVDSTMSPFSITARPFFKADAFKAQTILQGLMVSKEENLDPTTTSAVQNVPKRTNT